jgi:hypothetical protein
VARGWKALGGTGSRVSRSPATHGEIGGDGLDGRLYNYNPCVLQCRIPQAPARGASGDTKVHELRLRYSGGDLREGLRAVSQNFQQVASIGQPRNTIEIE